jgi:hypothetical protein
MHRCRKSGSPTSTTEEIIDTLSGNPIVRAEAICNEERRRRREPTETESQSMVSREVGIRSWWLAVSTGGLSVVRSHYLAATSEGVTD